MHCLEGWKWLILNILLYNLPEKQEETERLQNLPCVFIKRLNKRHRMCVFAVPNPLSRSTPMMMYLLWGAARVTCCQNHSGHAWSRQPSPISTGINHTGKVRAVWNQFQSQHVVCGKGLYVMTQQQDSALSQPLEMAACRCFFNKFPQQNKQPPFLF